MIYHGTNGHGGYCSLLCKESFDQKLSKNVVDTEIFEALYEFDLNNDANTTVITKNLLLCCAYDMIKVKTFFHYKKIIIQKRGGCFVNIENLIEL